MAPLFQQKRRGFGGIGESFGNADLKDKAEPTYGFFQVADADGVACQGFNGKLSLYRDASITFKWSNSVWAGHNPVNLSLELDTNQGPGLFSHAFTIVKNAPITAATNSFSYVLPADAPLPDLTPFALLGSYTDASGTVFALPTNTTNVVIVPVGMDCDRQGPIKTPINVPLAIGLGSTTAFLLILFTVITIIRSKKLARLEDKGKFWMDGPRSKHLHKPSLFDRILTRLRPKKKKPTKKSDDDDGEDGDSEKSSLGESGNSVNGGVVEEVPLNPNGKNPFISEQEEMEMHQVATAGYVVPLKDSDSSESSGSLKPSSKGKGPPTDHNVVRKSTTQSFGSSLYNKIKAAHEVIPLTIPTTDIGNTVRTVMDPVTGQMKTYVFLDSRGPPDRNTGGSSRWTPPAAVLNQKHRVLTVFSATEPDELTLARGEYVNVETVFEDGWAIVHKVEDLRYKPEATNSGKKGEKNVIKMPSAPRISGALPDASRASWGARVLRTLVKEDGGIDVLGDVATGGQRGVVPYNCLYLVHESYVYRPSNVSTAPSTSTKL
ncbi:UNVERIFIED_CONTAM: hypothetical protein HDU68_011320 [Siphonaria sp. JEL0065]|nr:hypothetical protein HDU68_011320 [Siphonaria sp. JEL0065]